MARQPVRKQNKKWPEKKPEAPLYRCRDCAHSYDWNNKAHDGRSLIFCRCTHDAKSLHGKFCKFLSDFQCDHFVKRSTPLYDGRR